METAQKTCVYVKVTCIWIGCMWYLLHSFIMTPYSTACETYSI